MPTRYGEGGNVRRIGFALLISGVLVIAGCGGGGSGSSSSNGGSSNGGGGGSAAGGNTIATQPANNVAPLTVDSGPTGGDDNQAFTTVTVCVPGSTPLSCVTIPHVWVDTGSVGLRIPASAFRSLSNGATVLAALQNVGGSTPVAECAAFGFGDLTSFQWGSVRSAEVMMGGAANNSEVANPVPIHIIGDSSVGSVPTDCSNGGTEEDTVAALGANGLLGVANFQYDCDFPGLPTGVGSNTFGIGNLNACASSSTPAAGTYYSCPASGCVPSLAAAGEQVRNPVSLFAADNNGVIVELEAVTNNAGQGTATGSLVFGIGTQLNNGLTSSAVVLPLDTTFSDPAWLGITTVYNGTSYPNSSSNTAMGSFFDTGSTDMFFLDQPTSGIASCANGYCPSSAQTASSVQTLAATNKATSGNSSEVQFNVGNADLLSTTSNTAFSDLASPVTSGNPDPATQAEDAFFDWGLPFFYGRNIYTAIWGVSPPSTPVSGGSVPAGPFWAY